MIFFFKQKTAYEMRISDWSSDVCSSDLRALLARDQRRAGERQEHRLRQRGAHVQRQRVVLAAVRLVGEHDHVAAVGQRLGALELLDQGEDIAVVAAQQLAQVRAAAGVALVALGVGHRARGLKVPAICSSSSMRSVTTTNVQLPTSLRSTFCAKNTIEKLLLLPCVCQNTPPRPWPSPRASSIEAMALFTPSTWWFWPMILTSPALCSENRVKFSTMSSSQIGR